jgi:hypothetical protein
MIIKNKIENLNGSIDCLVLIGDEWHPHTMDDANEYELHEESEWPDVKPYPQAEKDKHEKAEALRQADQDFIDTMSPITMSVSQLERDTWIVQEREAREWLADDTSPVPFITTLAEARGVELAELVGRIIVKADAYSVMLAGALGVKHKVEDDT